MISKNKIKLVRALETKKGRVKHGMFVAEGPKIVGDLLAAGFHLVELFDAEDDIKKVSFLQHPQGKVGIFRLPEQAKEPFLTNETQENTDHNEAFCVSELSLALDGVQDPGNLGTIIRLADWFGIEQIVCSEDCVDFYNPKVIQATMGSFTRVNVIYKDIAVLLRNPDRPVFGTDMVGQSLYKTDFPERFYLILGNEGNGIRPEIKKLVSQNITIPRFGKLQHTESLNVSMAAGIILGQIFSEK